MLIWQTAPRSRPIRILKCKIWGETPTADAFGHKNWQLCRRPKLGLCLGETHDTAYRLFLPSVSFKPHQAANELMEGEMRVSKTSVLTLRGTFSSGIPNFKNTHTFVFHYTFTRTTLTKWSHKAHLAQICTDSFPVVQYQRNNATGYKNGNQEFGNW